MRGKHAWRAPVGLALISSLAALLSACSLAPAIQRNTLDYNETIEEVSNKALVINVLRGRDRAPLYFPDLAIIRGSVAASASTQATLPYGPTFGTVQAGSFTASSNPTFDVAPTNTKKFYQGILNPVSGNVLAYYVERDRDADVAPTFNLLVGGIETVDAGRIRSVGWRSPDFPGYLQRWLYENADHPPRVVRNLGRDSARLGPPVKAEAKSIIDANAAGLQLRSSGANMMQILKRGGPTVCVYEYGGYVPLFIEENSVVKTPTGDRLETEEAEGAAFSACRLLDGPRGTASRRHVKYTLRLRSIEEMFYYLGSIVKEDDEGTLLLRSGPSAGCPRISFFIRSRPLGRTRFTVDYRGERYYVGDDAQPVGCASRQNYDRTLPILAIVNDLLNLSRDADEVPVTKAVQAVGGGT